MPRKTLYAIDSSRIPEKDADVKKFSTQDMRLGTQVLKNSILV